MHPGCTGVLVPAPGSIGAPQYRLRAPARPHPAASRGRPAAACAGAPHV